MMHSTLARHNNMLSYFNKDIIGRRLDNITQSTAKWRRYHLICSTGTCKWYLWHSAFCFQFKFPSVFIKSQARYSSRTFLIKNVYCFERIYKGTRENLTRTSNILEKSKSWEDLEILIQEVPFQKVKSWNVEKYQVKFCEKALVKCMSCLLGKVPPGSTHSDLHLVLKDRLEAVF